MRINTGNGWQDIGPSTGGRPYLQGVSPLDMPSVEDITRAAGCVVCGDETQGGRTFCASHRKWQNFRNPSRKAA